jgi:hypothetical protein
MESALETEALYSYRFKAGEVIPSEFLLTLIPLN